MRGRDGLAQLTEARCRGSFSASATVIPGIAAVAVKNRPGIDPAAMEIVAFDAAQQEIGVGEANTVIVSSFARQGCVWGLEADRARPYMLQMMEIDGVPVYPLVPALEAGRELLARCPIEPGSFVPAACKFVCKEGPARVGAALAYGVPELPGHAGMFMEEPFTDSWIVPEQHSFALRHRAWSVAASVLAIGTKRGIHFREIWAAAMSAAVPSGHTGCGLIYCPYLELPDPVPA